MESQGNRLGLASAKLPAKPPAKANSEFTLPPILKPLLNDEPRKKKKKPVEGSQAMLRNAESNIKETLERFP